jgi:hypothetical protein
MSDQAERRAGSDRRKARVRKKDRRVRDVPVSVERRSGKDRRATDRRGGRDRRDPKTK